MEFSLAPLYFKGLFAIPFFGILWGFHLSSRTFVLLTSTFFSFMFSFCKTYVQFIFYVHDLDVTFALHELDIQNGERNLRTCKMSKYVSCDMKFTKIETKPLTFDL